MCPDPISMYQKQKKTNTFMAESLHLFIIGAQLSPLDGSLSSHHNWGAWLFYSQLLTAQRQATGVQWNCQFYTQSSDCELRFSSRIRCCLHSHNLALKWWKVKRGGLKIEVLTLSSMLFGDRFLEFFFFFFTLVTKL